jgi:hypothetical protein
MLRKLTRLTLLTLLYFSASSQERFGSTKAVLEKVKTNGIQVGIDDLMEDMDLHLRAAFEKYWDFCPVKFVSKEEMDKNLPMAVLGDYKIMSNGVTYVFTKFLITNSTWMQYSYHFDNITAKGNCYGIDKSETEILNRIDLAVLNFCAQVKFLDGAYTDKNTRGINSWNGFNERLKNTTVLIPEEYLTNGLTKAAFARIPKKEFVPLQDINKKVGQKGPKKYSTLNVYRTVSRCHFNVLDLETGDYIYWADFGGALSGKPDLITDKEVGKLVEKMYDN